MQTHFGISSFSHPDNALEVCGLLTPLHIVPEWYFLCQYAMLKAVPNKNAGFIILLTSIFTFFLFPEIRNLTTFTRLMDYNNGFSLSSFFLSLLSFLWIGAQFPQEKFLCYGRILTLDFYFLIISCLYLLQTHFGISSFSHPDNALEVCGLVTPLHIVPEWYFLCQYAILKAVPNKNAGFIILITSILICTLQIIGGHKIY